MKTVPGPKELAQRAMQEARVERGAALINPRAAAKKLATPKKRGLIPYAGKPRVDSGLYGRKPGPKAPRKKKT
jgi:hypothetical protein